MVLGTIFYANIKLSMLAKKADAAAQGLLKNRLRAMKQVVEGVKAIKFYAWEESYAEKISEMRLAEVNAIKVSSFPSFPLFFFFLTTPLVSFFSFVNFLFLIVFCTNKPDNLSSSCTHTPSHPPTRKMNICVYVEI
jgi:hypothetical protein